MVEWLDGWMDGWLDGWLNGWMDEWMDGGGARRDNEITEHDCCMDNWTNGHLALLFSPSPHLHISTSIHLSIHGSFFADRLK